MPQRPSVPPAVLAEIRKLTNQPTEVAQRVVEEMMGEEVPEFATFWLWDLWGVG